MIQQSFSLDLTAWSHQHVILVMIITITIIIMTEAKDITVFCDEGI